MCLHSCAFVTSMWGSIINIIVAVIIIIISSSSSSSTYGREDIQTM